MSLNWKTVQKLTGLFDQIPNLITNQATNHTTQRVGQLVDGVFELAESRSDVPDCLASMVLRSVVVIPVRA